MRSIRIACLLLVVIAAAVPQPSIGQALPPGNELTPEQYDGLQERVPEFCSFLAESMRQGKMIPMGDVSIPGVGNGVYIYTGGEVIALIPWCESLMTLMQRMIDPSKVAGTSK